MGSGVREFDLRMPQSLRAAAVAGAASPSTATHSARRSSAGNRDGAYSRYGRGRARRKLP